MEKHTTEQCLDFFHATEYLADVADSAFPIKTDKSKREAWLNERCKQLKHNTGAIDTIIAEMEIFAKNVKNYPRAFGKICQRRKPISLTIAIV